MTEPNPSTKPYVLPVLLMLAVVLVLVMLRLGVWQLDRAEQRQTLVDQVLLNSKVPVELDDLVQSFKTVHTLPADTQKTLFDDYRFRPLTIRGQYQAEYSLLIENQVHQNRGGYQVITAFQPVNSEQMVMVSRGWIAAGETRQDLPAFATPTDTVTLNGRLALPYPKPPLWKEDYPVSEGIVWQYLPIDKYAQQIGVSVLPLMLELAPEKAGSDGLVTRWNTIDDSWVNKHKAYAVQWFAMALVFSLLCLFLLLRRRTQAKP